MAGKLIVDTIDTDNAFITLNVQQSTIATMNVSGIYSNTGVKMIGANGSVSNTAITGVITASQLATSLNLATNNVQVTSIQTATGTPGITFAANGQITLANTPLQLTGGQIVFPAAQVASSDANTLDDYEEGTFTPTVTASGAIASFTYVSQVANYVKIGKTVYISLNIQISSLAGGSSGTLRVSSLPFTVSTAPTYGAVAMGYIEQTGGTAPNTALATSNHIQFYNCSGGSVTAIGFGSLSAFNYYIAGTYTTT